MSDLIKLDMPTPQFLDLVSWFSSALRQNETKLSHYLDNTKGQGMHLESLSKKSFFEILNVLVQKLKVYKDLGEIKTILGAIKWKYVARDHADLVNLNIFQALHKGNGDKENILRKAWGRNVGYDCKKIDD